MKKTGQRQKRTPQECIEVIDWYDHHEPSTHKTWGMPTPRRALRPVKIRSTGFVVSENARMLELVRDMAEDDVVGARLHIMKKAIISRRKFYAPPLTDADSK